MLRKTFIIVSLLVLSLSFAFCEEKVKWINININEPSEETNVQVHLPLSLINAAVKSVNTEDMHLGKVKLPVEKSEVDFVQVLQEIKKAPDADYVKIDDKNAYVVVTKKKGIIYINVTEKQDKKAKVEVRVPASILDALKVDENNELDIANIFSELANFDGGDSVTVVSDDTNIRIWIE